MKIEKLRVTTRNGAIKQAFLFLKSNDNWTMHFCFKNWASRRELWNEEVLEKNNKGFDLVNYWMCFTPNYWPIAYQKPVLKYNNW